MPLFAANDKVKRSDVHAACFGELGLEIPQNVYSKIMKELATSKNNVWTFKKNAS